MESTPTKMIRKWCQTNIKKSLQAKRTEALNILDKLPAYPYPGDDSISSSCKLGLVPTCGVESKTAAVTRPNLQGSRQPDGQDELAQNGNQLCAA